MAKSKAQEFLYMNSLKASKDQTNTNDDFDKFTKNNFNRVFYRPSTPMAAIAKPKKSKKEYIRKPAIFKSFDNIMENINRRAKRGAYCDIVTKAKLKKQGQEKTSKVDPNYFSESSSESEDEEVEQTDFVESIIYKRKTGDQMNSLYWNICKIFRYLRISNQPGTLICLCTLNESTLKDSSCVRAIEDSNGIALLLNLVTVDDIRCQIATLKVLKVLSEVNQNSRNITFLGGIEPLVQCLDQYNCEVKSLAADILARLSIFKTARSYIRRHKGIPKLVNLLDIDLKCLEPSGPDGTIKDSNAQVAQSCCEVLWVCSKSRRNQNAMRKAGLIPLMAKLLVSCNSQVLVPLIGILQQCAVDKFYKTSIRTEGMIPVLISHLHSENTWLKVQCALTIFKCAEDEATRKLVRLQNGLESLHELLRDSEDRNVLYAVSGAIWKCCLSKSNALVFQNMGTLILLVELIKNIPEEFKKYLRPQVSASEKLNRIVKIEKILTNVMGALSELTKYQRGREIIRCNGGIKPLVTLLNYSHNDLLVNVSRTISQCALDPESMKIMTSLDGIRQLVSQLNNPNELVQASAAWALSPIIEHAPDSGTMIRCFVGCLETVVNLLKSSNEEVLIAICSTIAQIAMDKENLACLTDHGIVQLLSRLIKTETTRLRYYLAIAIARTCAWKDNSAKFGSFGVVIPLVSYLLCTNKKVHSATAQALFQLSSDPTNSIEMNQAGVTKYLVGMIGSEDEDLQFSAAGTIGNIRRLALMRDKFNADKYTLQQN